MLTMAMILSLLLLLPNLSSAIIHDRLDRRQFIQDNQLHGSYDYVVVGGGLAGLVVASRLSEDSKTTVLVLEAGKSGDDVKARVDSPAGTYYSSLLDTEYDWSFKTVPQSQLSNRTISQPRGKILGGSTAVNALYVVRPSKIEVDAWAELLAGNGIDSTSANRWNWDTLYRYMKKAEQFTPPTQTVLSVAKVNYDESSYGKGGPLQISYPAMLMNMSSTWTQSCAALGIPEHSNPNGGLTLGSFISPSTINPSNLTRSYSRSAYIDSLPPRPNLHILTEYTVLKFNFASQTDSGKKVASSVEFGKNKDGDRKKVEVGREVILAAGALSTPKILMSSGVGPRDVLETASIKVEVELPGVGQRLQDHMTALVVFNSTYETAGDIHASNSNFSLTREFNSFVNNAVAFTNASSLFDGGSEDFKKRVMDSIEDSVTNLVPSRYDEVKKGYRVVYELMAGKWLGDTSEAAQIGQIELLMSLISPKMIVSQTAMQHPFSIGRVYVNSSNPWDDLLIDPGYFTHWADIVIMRQGIRILRRLGQAFGAAIGLELVPGLELQSDAAVDEWLVNDGDNGAKSQFHPTGTCSLLPKSLGGVVDADLKVYEIANVRVIDGSVFPFEFAAHLASIGYGVAEQAADLIKATTKKSGSNSSSYKGAFHVGWASVLILLLLRTIY